MEVLPAVKPGQLVGVIRDPNSKATIELALRTLLEKKYGETAIDWANGPPP
jgi:hypothetical protein